VTERALNFLSRKQVEDLSANTRNSFASKEKNIRQVFNENNQRANRIDLLPVSLFIRDDMGIDSRPTLLMVMDDAGSVDAIHQAFSLVPTYTR
jgi:hypothetical protein